MSQLPVEIDVVTVKQMRDSGDDFLILDVRNPDEYATAKIEGTTLIPMSEIPNRLGELDTYKDKRIVVHCHHGGRSLRVTTYLRQNGFMQAQNMTGGIDEWSKQIDASVPRY